MATGASTIENTPNGVNWYETDAPDLLARLARMEQEREGDACARACDRIWKRCQQAEAERDEARRLAEIERSLTPTGDAADVCDPFPWEVGESVPPVTSADPEQPNDATQGEAT